MRSAQRAECDAPGHAGGSSRGRNSRCGTISSSIMSLITSCMIEATPVSVANPVHAPFSLVRMCVPGAGGGSRPIIVNVDYIRNISIRKKGKLLFTCRKVAFHLMGSNFSHDEKPLPINACIRSSQDRVLQSAVCRGI